MGGDKALVPLAGRTFLERILATAAVAGAADIVVVRSPDQVTAAGSSGGGTLPEPGRDDVPAYRVVTATGHMIDSVCAGLDAPAQGDGTPGFLVWPVDMPLIAATDVLAVTHALARGAAIAVPTAPADQRLGHPFGFAPELAEEVRAAAAAGGSLRDLLRRSPDRVVRIPSGNPWVRRDLDDPNDAAAAEAALAVGGLRPVTEWMAAHRSRRKFSEQEVPPQQLERLMDAARYASTSSFIQAGALVVVTERERKARCAALCADQAHIHGAPVFVAVCADLHRIATACHQHGATLQHENLEIFLQATVDAALLGQNLLLAAESEGLGGCMIGAARNHPVELARELDLPEHCYVVFGLVLGVPADDPVPRGRMPLAGVVHHGTYDRDAAVRAVGAADQAMVLWARDVNRRIEDPDARRVREDKGWSDRMAGLWGAGSRYVAERGELLARLQELGWLTGPGFPPAGPSGDVGGDGSPVSR